jgi:biopolymer transport protein ExbB
MFMEMGFQGIMNTNPAIMWTLFVFSVLLLGAVLERAFYYLAYGGWSDAFWKKVSQTVKKGLYHEARTICERSSNVFAQVFRVAVESSHLSRADNEDMVQIAKENMQERLRKRLGLFSTLSFISPLVGLLGTVTGIMQAFSDLGRSGSGGANIVAAGISEALITTATGIIVAVPAAIFFNFFTYRLRAIVSQMNNYSQELIILIYGGEEIGSKPHQPKASEMRAKAR